MVITGNGWIKINFNSNLIKIVINYIDATVIQRIRGKLITKSKVAINTKDRDAEIGEFN